MKNEIATKSAVARLGLVLTLLVGASQITGCQQQPKNDVSPQMMADYNKMMKSGGLKPTSGGPLPAQGPNGGMKPMGGMGSPNDPTPVPPK